MNTDHLRKTLLALLTSSIACAHGLARANEPAHNIYAWGLDESGLITPPSEEAEFIAIAAGDTHSLALKSGGSIVGWGWDFSGHGLTSSPPGSEGKSRRVHAIIWRWMRPAKSTPGVKTPLR